MREQARSFGAEFLTDKVVGVDLQATPKMVLAGTNTFKTQAILLATGSMGRSHSTPSEAEFLGRGVSYCATCDGAFFKEQPVAVVGNNDEAWASWRPRRRAAWWLIGICKPTFPASSPWAICSAPTSSRPSSPPPMESSPPSPWINIFTSAIKSGSIGSSALGVICHWSLVTGHLPRYCH